MDRKLRICYFAEKDSIHIWRWLDYFHDGGHEVFLYCGFGTGFKRWPVSVADRSECVPDIMMRPAPINVPQSVSRWKPLYSAFRPVYSRIIGVFNKSRELALLARRLRSQLAQVNPDVVHALWLWDNALYAHTAGFHPYVITPLGSDIWDVDAYSKGKSSRFRHMLRSADAVTAGAQSLLDVCQHWGAKARRSHLIAAPGINVSFFEKPQTAPLPAVQELRNHGKIIFCPRSLNPLYRIGNVVTAFQQVLQHRPQCHLLLLKVHSVPDRYDVVMRLIAQLGLGERVTILDKVPYEQMPHLYALSSVVVSIPATDAIPQAGFEAFAARRPLVISDLPQYNGVLVHEQNVLRVPGDDPTAVAQAIVRILEDDDLRQRLVSNGFDTVRQCGDLHREMEKLEALYLSLLPSSQRTRK